MKLLLLVVLAGFVAPLIAADGEWFVHLNGTSRHFNRRDLNEENWGAGVTYLFNPTHRWAWAAEADFFKDSFDDPSGLVGGSLRRRFRYGDVGLLGFIMYRKTGRKHIGSSVFPGVLPFIEVGGTRLRLRSAYIPPVTGRDDEALTFQLLLRL